MKEEIKNFLLSTEREGIEDLIAYMEEIGYFTAPASSQYHGAYEGALAEHSLNVLKSGKVSDTKPFERNKDLLTLPHEVVSCVEIAKFIDLTEEEQLAIAWHNGLYGAFKYDIQGNETPLYMIIHWADMWASRVVETKTKGGE